MRLTPAIKTILLATLAVFGLQVVMGHSFDSLLGLHFWGAKDFHLWQPITYMLLHADFNHIFCNMLAVFFFGPAVEQYLGTKRFYWFYLLSGIGAALVQEIMWTVQIGNLLGGEWLSVQLITNQMVTIGASGAVFGILLAFGWFFPDEKIFLFLIPIPIRARIFVTIYALVELFAGVHSTDNVAHFAHLGGMLAAWLILLYWRQRPREMHSSESLWNRMKGWWNRVAPKMNETQTKGQFHYQARVNKTTPTEEAPQKKERTAEIDAILDKVKEHGYASLSEEEKRKLFS